MHAIIAIAISIASTAIDMLFAVLTLSLLTSALTANTAITATHCRLLLLLVLLSFTSLHITCSSAFIPTTTELLVLLLLSLATYCTVIGCWHAWLCRQYSA
jgi:hypothetical protein